MPHADENLATERVLSYYYEPMYWLTLKSSLFGKMIYETIPEKIH